MDAAREAIEDAKPLLQQAVKLSDEVGGRAAGRRVAAWGLLPR